MNTSRSALINDTTPLLGANISVAAYKKSRLMRQCPKCLRKWPFDWDYCPECAISIRGREIIKQIIHLVPSGDLGTEKQNSAGDPTYAEGVFVACEFQCDSDPPSPENFRQAKRLMGIALEMIASQCGTARILPDLGIVGCWDGGAPNTDMAV